MKRHVVVLLSLLAVVSIGIARSRASAPPQTERPSAVLTSCKGPVTVLRSGGTTSGAFGLALDDGDQVRTGKDAEAEIMFASGDWVQIGPNSSMRIKGRPTGAAPAATDKFEVVQNFLKLKNSEGTSSIGALRGVDHASELVAVSPVQTRVRDARPTFRWTTRDTKVALRFTLYDESGVLWKKDVSGVTSMAYPSDAPALEPGVSYSWTLESTDPLVAPPLRTTAAFFQVLAPSDAHALASELAAVDAGKSGTVTYHVMRAGLFFRHGLVDDAIAETETAVAADPDNRGLEAILGHLYAEAGRAQDALDAMQKSEQH